MNAKKTSIDIRGFSLIEILIVVAMLGLVMTSIYGLYISNQRTAYDQESVVDIQQNLRIAMDMIGRDIQLAGFLVSENPIANAPAAPASGSTLKMRTASAKGCAARIAQDFNVPSELSDTEGTFDVASSEMAQFFKTGDIVRIIRPANTSQAISREFTVTGVHPSDVPPTLTLDGFAATDKADYPKGDMIVLTQGASEPNTVEYFKDGDEIKRITNGGSAQVVADQISTFTCTYLDDAGTETATLSNIRAVQVTITGATSGALSDGTPRQRTLTDTFAIRN